MSSLREQLLKAGLVNEKQVKEAEKQRRKHADKASSDRDARKRSTQEAQAAKAARDRELNRRRSAQAEAKSRAAQVRQLVEQYRLPPLETDDYAYFHFQDGKYVRRVAVDAARRRQIHDGELLVARYGKRYALVPESAAARIRERDPDAIVDLEKSTGSSSADDAYAGFEIPDDVIW